MNAENTHPGLTKRDMHALGWPKEIASTSGTERLSYAYDVFSNVDTLFALLGGSEDSNSTEKTEIGIYQVTEAHTFANVFECIAENLDKACVTLNQVKEFARANWRWIVDGDRLLYFLYKHRAGYGVASIVTDPLFPRHMAVVAFKYDDEMAWPGRMAQIFVVPKQ